MIKTKTSISQIHLMPNFIRAGKNIFRFFMLFFIVSALIACHKTIPQNAIQASPLKQTVEKMVKSIKEKTPLAGQSIQISENNFWERNSCTNLPFSRTLSDMLAAELSRQGAIVTLQETGEQPLRLFGSYTNDSDIVTITTRLRKMGESGGLDIAVVQGRLNGKNLNPNWFDMEFGRIARTLVRQLETNYHGLERPIDVRIQPWEPGLSGQATLQIGREMARYVENALSCSPVFRPVAAPGKGADTFLNGTYDRIGNQFTLHVNITKSDRVVSSTDFSLALADVPSDLLKPGIQSLKDAVDALVGKLAKTCKKNTGLANNPEFRKIFINSNYFNDPQDESTYPFSLKLNQAFQRSLHNTGFFSVTDNPKCFSGLFLTGAYHRDGERLMLSVKIRSNMDLKNSAIKKFDLLATAHETLNKNYWADDWFTPSVKGKMDYLMFCLEQKYSDARTSDQNHKLLVNSFTFEHTRLYSPFSHYISQYAKDYFSGNLLFTPVTDVEQQLKKIQSVTTRSIVPNQTTGGTIAEIAKASCLIQGNYWNTSSDKIEVHGELTDVQGEILASARIRIPTDLVCPSQLKLPQADDANFMDDLDILIDPDTTKPLSVELFTQKGRNNLSFANGESIVFYIKSNRAAYVRIFNRTPDGTIYRIYPNDYDTGHRPIPPNSVTAVPNINYNQTFEFSVEGATGNELVFAYASEKPLDELPGVDLGHGMRQISLTVKQIHEQYTEHAARYGYALFRDVIALRTTK